MGNLRGINITCKSADTSYGALTFNKSQKQYKEKLNYFDTTVSEAQT